MKKFDYSIIPSFTLFDRCKLSMILQKGEPVDSVIHTKIDFSMDHDGNLNEDMNTKPNSSERAEYFIVSEVEYTKKFRGFSSKKCCQQLLKDPNISEYSRLVAAEQGWIAELENVKDENYAKNIFTYFIQIRKKYESWFWNNEVDVSKYLVRDNIVTSDNSSNVITNEKNKHKKDISKEVNMYLKVVKEIEDIPKLKTLQKKTGISISTWHRRYSDKTFTLELNNKITKEREKFEPNSQLSRIFDDIQEMCVGKLKQKSKTSKDILTKGKRSNIKPIDEYEAPILNDSPDQNDGEYEAISSFNGYKFILN